MGRGQSSPRRDAGRLLQTDDSETGVAGAQGGTWRSSIPLAKLNAGKRRGGPRRGSIGRDWQRAFRGPFGQRRNGANLRRPYGLAEQGLSKAAMVALRGGSSNQTSRFSRLADAPPTLLGRRLRSRHVRSGKYSAGSRRRKSSSSLPSTERATACRNLLGNCACIGQP